MLSSKIIREVERLSIKERLALMEYLARSVQKDLPGAPRRTSKKPQVSELPEGIEFSRGMLSHAGIPPLTDDEVEELIGDSLLKEYLDLR